MSPANRHLSERAAKAERIIAAPLGYKVCEGCESIVARRLDLCPNCSGYRFDLDPARIAAQARVLASRAQTTVTALDLL